jgi:hypothetical protein
VLVQALTPAQLPLPPGVVVVVVVGTGFEVVEVVGRGVVVGVVEVVVGFAVVVVLVVVGVLPR